MWHIDGAVFIIVSSTGYIGNLKRICYNDKWIREYLGLCYLCHWWWTIYTIKNVYGVYKNVGMLYVISEQL